MVVLKGVISFAGNLLNRAKWSLKSQSDIARSSTSFFSTKVDVPEPPKRPLTAYIIFCKENRPDIVKDNPNLRGAELIKLLAERWSALTPQSKKPYEESAREGTIVYGRQHKEFYENLTEEQRVVLEELKIQRRESKKVQKLKKVLKGSGMPRHPFNAYTLFVQSKAKEFGTIKSGPYFIKQVAEEWNALSEEAKKIFYEKAKEEKAKYESKLSDWRNKLAAEGKVNLLKSYEEGKYRQRVTASSTSETTKKTVSAAKKSVSKKMAKSED